MANTYLSQKLKTLRENCGYTQEQVANVLNIERSSYTYYEIGKTEPNLSSLVKLANLFKVSVEDLLGEAPPSPLLSDSDTKKQLKKNTGKSTDNDSYIYDLDKNEKQLLGYYRALNPTQKKSFLEMAQQFSNQNK